MLAGLPPAGALLASALVTPLAVPISATELLPFVSSPTHATWTYVAVGIGIMALTVAGTIAATRDGLFSRRWSIAVVLGMLLLSINGVREGRAMDRKATLTVAHELARVLERPGTRLALRVQTTTTESIPVMRLMNISGDDTTRVLLTYEQARRLTDFVTARTGTAPFVLPEAVRRSASAD